MMLGNGHTMVQVLTNLSAQLFLVLNKNIDTQTTRQQAHTPRAVQYCFPFKHVGPPAPHLNVGGGGGGGTKTAQLLHFG